MSEGVSTEDIQRSTSGMTITDQVTIQMDGVHKWYGDFHVLKDINLTVNKGERIVICGPSGSGKSTLMNLIGCLDRPTEGTYLLDDIDVSHLDRNELADIRNQKLGFVFQGFNLLSRTTALENVELPLLYGHKRLTSKSLRERAERSLEIVGLSDRAEHYPSQLSGGQQQRVAIARALVNEPQILVADEPTGNLDSKTSVEILGVFQKLNDAGITVLMVTHELDIAQYSRRNIIMRDGRIVSDVQVGNRLQADIEMKRLLAAEAEAKLTEQN